MATLQSQAPRREDPSAIAWDDETDVVVVGFGGAGACAALQAHQDGGRVIVLDRFAGGGATAISGGVFYAGGGTHIQQQAGVQDSVEDMFTYLKLETQGIVSDRVLRDFCESSVTNLKWLEGHGVPFEASLCPVKTSYPTDDYYLYYSGNEGMRPFRDQARPAPRGHRAKGDGLPGASFYEPLREATLSNGVDVRYGARATRLIVDGDNRTVGVEYKQVKAGLWRWLHKRLHSAGIAIVKYHPATAKWLQKKCFAIEAKHTETRIVRAHGGVVLSAGGFIYNRAMIKQYAPSYRKGMPLGTASDDGAGIKLGVSVGGAVDRMGRVSAWRFINPPEAFAKGMIVNRNGERYINEFRYGAAIGEAMVDENDGTALLIIDSELKKAAREQSRRGQAQWFQRAPALINLWFNCRKAETIDELAQIIKAPAETIKATFDVYNAAANGDIDDPFGKDRDKMHAMQTGPYFVIDCSLGSKRFMCPTLTLGGLVVDEDSGLVKDESGQPIAGLYAAGRNAVGVCSRQYVSGLSIADCVYSGRRAGAHAVRSVLGAQGELRTDRRTDSSVHPAHP